MKARLKKSTKFISLALVAALFVSLICMSGSAYPGEVSDGNQSWGNLPAALPIGTVNYYVVNCVSKNDLSTVSKYLKIEKRYGGMDDTLVVYEGDTLYDLVTMYETAESTNFIAVNEGFTMADCKEAWTVGLRDEYSGYSKILSVSPLCTTVTATQTWNAMEGNGVFAEVSDQTTVKYVLKNDSGNVQYFMVRKVHDWGSQRLQISLDGMSWTDDNMVLESGKTINAFLKPAESSYSPEQWIITVTGYERHDIGRKLIEYKIVKEDVSSTQAWIGGETQLKHTFGGAVTAEEAVFNYSLMLKTASSDQNEINILRIEKRMVGNTVESIVVSGMSGSGEYEPMVYSTVINAVSGSLMQYSDGSFNQIAFNRYSAITVEDIINSEDGITVYFNIGRDNGSASVTLKLTESGRLSYDFDGLPAESFVPDPETTPIPVDSYRVTVTKY